MYLPLNCDLREVGQALLTWPSRGRRLRFAISENSRASLAYITELVHRRPKIWIRDIDRMHDMLERHTDDAMRAACERGLAERGFGAEYIAHYLSHRGAIGAGTQQELFS